MFGWLTRGRKKKKAGSARKAERKPKSEAMPGEAETGQIIQPGSLLLRQELVTDKGTEKLYVQPVKLEIPNMVTIGGKLDLILDELEKKPDKEWFQTDYIETLKNVLTLTSEVNASGQGSGPDAQKMAQTIDLIQKEVSSALILETLKVKGPLNITELSKETGVSRVTIWRDLKKLSKQGRIRIKRQGKFKVASLR
jgi:biotin operon repressor